jgi:tetratricopeptide (TPR) repeat protein
MLYTGIGHSLIKLKRYSDAIPCYSKIKELEDSYVSYFNLACCFALLGDYEKCTAEINQILNTKKYSEQLYAIDKHNNRFNTDCDFDNIREDKNYGKIFKALSDKYEAFLQEILVGSDKNARNQSV